MNDLASAPADAAPINPLSAAFDNALSGGENSAPPPSDFIESTLALLDAPDLGEADSPDDVASEGVGNTSSTPGDLLDSIDDEFPDLDDKSTPLAKERWGELKKELKQERSAIRAMKEELEQLKQKSLYDPAEVDTLKQQLDEYNRELSVHRIEATQEYKRAIEEPLEIIGEAAASVARRYEIDQEDLFDALAMEDEGQQQKLLSDIVDGMSDRDRLKVYQMADDTLLILRRRSEMKSRSQEAMQELEIRQRQTEERTQAERKRTYASHMDRLFEALEDKMPFHPLDPNESKAAVLEKLKQDALAADVTSAGPDVQAYSAAAVVMIPRLINQFRALSAENRALKNRLGNTSAASPTRARQVAGPPVSTNVSTDFLENIFSQLPG
jgi:Tfp pilus assembly protein PilN